MKIYKSYIYIDRYIDGVTIKASCAYDIPFSKGSYPIPSSKNTDCHTEWSMFECISGANR